MGWLNPWMWNLRYGRTVDAEVDYKLVMRSRNDVVTLPIMIDFVYVWMPSLSIANHIGELCDEIGIY